MKRLLFLGGGIQQIPAIRQALAEGYYVISCGYRADDPGHHLTHEFFEISTTDADAVYHLASSRNVQRVISYASDASAPIAVLVSERLGLPDNPYQPVKIMTEKDLLRAFLRDNGFSTPDFRSFSDSTFYLKEDNAIKLPAIIKPVDSSGSRGVSRIRTEPEIPDAVSKAFSHSNCGRVIVEEVIETNYPQVTGDGFVVDGKLEFLHLGDHIFLNDADSTVAICTTWPSRLPVRVLDKIKGEMGRLIRTLGYRNGPVNVDIRVGINDEVYVIDIAPRNGANYVPQITQMSTGVDLVKCLFDVIDGRKPRFDSVQSRFLANYILHTRQSGYFDKLEIAPRLQEVMEGLFLRVKKGDKVNSFNNHSDGIGTIIMKFSSRKQMADVVSKIGTLITIHQTSC